MSVMDTARATARERGARIVFPEMEDARVGEAAAALERDGLCHPLPLGGVTDAQVAAVMDARGMKERMARHLLSKPLMRAAAMVAAGEADAMVAGADVPTRRVIEAAGLCIGLAEGIARPSSFFLMIFPDGREMIFADCAVTVAPDAEALAAIARASAASAEALLGRAEVALLSFSTGTSGAGDSVDVVRAAAEATGFAGPVQADAALDPAKGARKGVAVEAVNTLVFPSLDAGNIGYKLCQELAGAQAVGPMLQGFRRPVCDLSRGASAGDIVEAATLTAAMA
ncbi:phosphate acetyltransferase [Jannaschia sp. Os4]|uniref:phosphate acyltransferase n=1 Tax=Jannaschia sp. Os4 TaxID=2807617 RepID=UPI00193ADD12|nr:phosphate acyltransferase [Jannaschia sp. Os4]MBM2577986.1 phosphate acetyltransferase [Jannaschia sp. Os4]